MEHQPSHREDSLSSAWAALNSPPLLTSLLVNHTYWFLNAMQQISSGLTVPRSDCNLLNKMTPYVVQLNLLPNAISHLLSLVPPMTGKAKVTIVTRLNYQVVRLNSFEKLPRQTKRPSCLSTLEHLLICLGPTRFRPSCRSGLVDKKWDMQSWMFCSVKPILVVGFPPQSLNELNIRRLTETSLESMVKCATAKGSSLAIAGTRLVTYQCVSHSGIVCHTQHLKSVSPIVKTPKFHQIKKLRFEFLSLTLVRELAPRLCRFMSRREILRFSVPTRNSRVLPRSV